MSCGILGCIAAIAACSAAPVGAAPAHSVRLVSLARMQRVSSPIIPTRLTYSGPEAMDFNLPDKASWNERADIRLHHAKVVYTRAF